MRKHKFKYHPFRTRCIVCKDTHYDLFAKATEISNNKLNNGFFSKLSFIVDQCYMAFDIENLPYYVTLYNSYISRNIPCLSKKETLIKEIIE